MKASFISSLLIFTHIANASPPSSNDNRAHLRTISWYRQKPHDTALYDVLNIRYDASSGEIAKSYRKLSLDWHPDKIRRRKLKEKRSRNIKESASFNDGGVPPPPPPPPPSDNTSIIDIEEYASVKLSEIQNAYEILSNDQTRLLYHRYGIQNGIEGAIQLLTGKMYSSGSATLGNDEQVKLLQLMGHPPHLAHDAKEARIHYLTATIVEKLRPLVEGTVSQDLYVQSIYDESASLSKSALGKQILRCVGRAYRREGYRILRTMNKKMDYSGFGGVSYSSTSKQSLPQHKITDLMHDSWNNMRHLASAAFASGKLAITEAKLKRLQRERKMRNSQTSATKMITKSTDNDCDDAGKEGNIHSSIVLDNIGALFDDTDEESIDEIGSMFSDEEGNDEELDDTHFQHIANEKTYNALLTVHQTEVLWKLTKMDLDSTIREACRRMLSPASEVNGGWYSFFPSQNSPYYNHDWNDYQPDLSMPYYCEHPQDGWVGLNGNAVPTEVGRLRAAAALVLVGDIFVRCGKGVT